jgi:light-regulated signal transduction histidine kinase (bacteriophytochrome)
MDLEIESLSKALEMETQRRRELQAQLDRANLGFEEFVSTAAHDLRESLRDVAAFSQLLAEDGAGAGECVDRIRQGAARMQSLLSDMMDYWTIGTSEGQSSLTDMEAVLDRALMLSRPQGAVLTRDPLPCVRGDFHALTRILHHLIQNAIQYCGRPDPRVHVSSERRDLEWVISVRDNGPGIDPAFQERIFGAFKRLHGKEFPGNGLGLAFCKKAIESQGGHIWVTSTSEAGSTFYFSLPAA